ncbi:MAG: hypothetical protein CSA95_08155 [Bacteroidetes bacterium]|nr:MAG: hypothetical protein CSA95_08155 [Bacteroidota bacterium]PIE87662.1 MAG: hypothetical protein CSA04_05860 [Bacteroidota bacterium]
MKAVVRFSVILFSLLITIPSWGCTTLVVSGKATPDGRPLLWKLRDTEVLENKMIWIKEEGYAFIGMINANDEKGENIWSGSNEKGFSIMNSASFNVNMEGKSDKKDCEGTFMRKALAHCASLAEFEALLEKEPRPMGLAAHFGVIDAQGGAAFYEVNNHTWTKFDANDEATAPNGYVLRTNYSLTGKERTGYGFVRFETAQQLLEQARERGKISYQTIIQTFSRCFVNSLTQEDFRAEYETVPFGEHYVNSGDLITRYGSSSGMVIQGVRKGEDPLLTTLWTTIGFPNTCCVIPLWCGGGEHLPALLTAPGTENAPLNEKAAALQEECYPRAGMGSGYKYLQIGRLINREGNGYVQQIEAFEQAIFQQTEAERVRWRQEGFTKEDIQRFYTLMDQKVTDFYEEMERHKPMQASLEIKAGVFNKNGDSPYCITDALEALAIDPAITTRVVSAADIMSGRADDLDLILFPGGGGRSETGSLGEQGMERVVQLVTEKGMGVIGICAGAYILTKTPDYPSLGLSGAEAIDIAHDHRGHGLVKFSLTPQGKELFPELAEREILYSQYYEGPVLIEATDSPWKYTELATMLSDVHLVEGTPENMTNNRPFILVTENGAGMSASVVGHPESTPGMRWIIPRLARIVTKNRPIPYHKLAVRPEIHTQEMLYTKEEARKQRKAYYNLTGSKEEKIAAMKTIVEGNAWSAKKWIPPMIRDNDPEVRKLAAELTLFIERTDAIPDLEAALQTETSPQTKAAIEEAIQKLNIIRGGYE